MKKSLIVAVLVVGFSLIAYKVHAGNQYNWGTSTGGAWVTPDDTKTAVNQIIGIGSGGGANAVIVSSPTFAGSVFPLFISSGAFASLTPTTTGQIAVCSNCVNTLLVVSTGTGVGAWAGVFVSTGNSTGGAGTGNNAKLPPQ